MMRYLLCSTVVGVALIGWSAAGCDSDFDSVTEVTKFRVLGVSVTPPEIHPGYDGPVSFEVLWHHPEPQQEVQFGWVLCAGDLPMGAGLRYCTLLDQTIRPELGSAADGGDRFLVERVQFPQPVEGDESDQGFVATVVVLMCAGGQLPDPSSWLDVHREVANLDDLCVGGEGLHALKNFIASVPRPLGDPPVIDEPNANPQLASLSFQPGTMATEDTVRITCQNPTDCGPEIGITAAFTPESYQRYHTEALDEVEAVVERPFVSWFATGGAFDDIRSISDNPNQPARVGWAIAAPGTYHLWAVAHDRRGGASWWTFRVEVIE